MYKISISVETDDYAVVLRELQKEISNVIYKQYIIGDTSDKIVSFSDFKSRGIYSIKHVSNKKNN